MSAEFAEFDEREPQDAGEVFMMTFAVVGGLTLLEMEPASASLPATPLTVAEAQALLGGAPPPSPSQMLLASPAAYDAVFQAAVAALSPPEAGMTPPFALPPASGTGSDLGALDVFPATLQDNLGDDALGSSTPPAALEPASYSVRGDDLVVSLATGATLVIGGDNDLVLTSAHDTIQVLSGSSVALVGAGAQVALGARDQLSLTGVGFDVSASGADDVVSVGAHSQATIVGDGVETVLAANAAATVGGSGSLSMQAASTVNLMDASTLTAYGAGAAYLGANDYLTLFGGFDVFAPQSSGASALAGFGGDDTLHLQSSFNDIASLLGAATTMDNATVLRLDNFGDALRLVGLDKAAVSSLADSGHILLD